MTAITTLGVLLVSKTFPTTRAGHRALVTWARGFGSVRRAGVELLRMSTSAFIIRCALSRIIVGSRVRQRRRQGLFELLGDHRRKKLSEIAEPLTHPPCVETVLTHVHDSDPLRGLLGVESTGFGEAH